MAVELLTTDNHARAAEIALELDRCNADRQAVDRKILEEAHAIIKAEGGLNGRGAIVLGHRDWHAGVIGIVAGRLAEIYHRPTSRFFPSAANSPKVQPDPFRASTCTKPSRIAQTGFSDLEGIPPRPASRSRKNFCRLYPEV